MTYDQLVHGGRLILGSATGSTSSATVAAGLIIFIVYALLRYLLARRSQARAPLLLTSSAGAVDESTETAAPAASARAADESTDTTTPAAPASDNNWRWARRIEIDERIAEAALRKQEAAAISALEQDR